MANRSTSSASLPNGASENLILDSSSPLFLHASDNPGIVLVSKQFDGNGFNAWKRAIEIALSAKNKLGIVNGEVAKPESESSLLAAWNRCNHMVISWMLNSLSKEIAESVIYISTAHEMWKELIERFEQSNGTLIYQAQKELFSIVQGTDSISSYYTRIKKIWDELRALQAMPNCSCGAIKALDKYLEDQKLFQFLMGLNDSFASVKGHVLMMSPLPNVNQAYALLVHEEKQKEISAPVSSFVNESVAMNVNPGRNFTIGQYQKYDQNKKASVTCNYCKKPGHTKDKCYRLHGYPADFKFQRPKKFSGSVQSELAENVRTDSINVPQISSEQYSHILNLLSQLKMPDTEHLPNTLAATSFAGPFHGEGSDPW